MEILDLSPKSCNKFGSIQAVLSASELELREVTGIGDASIFLFKLLKDTFSRILLPVDKKENILSNWNSVVSFCKFTMTHRSGEELRAFLYLNKKMP